MSRILKLELATRLLSNCCGQPVVYNFDFYLCEVSNLFSNLSFKQSQSSVSI